MPHPNKFFENFDVCSSRHGGNEQSIAANRRANVSKGSDREAILSYLAKGNATSKEIAFKLRKNLHVVSGRISELKRAKLIRIKPGEPPREGCAVLELIAMDETTKQEITAAVRREQIVKTILDLSALCGYTVPQLNNMINTRFEIEDGLDACSFVELTKIKDGLAKKAETIVSKEDW